MIVYVSIRLEYGVRAADVILELSSAAQALVHGS
jgi:hypothetical protein